MPRILDSLPDLYERLLPAFFRRDIPPETKATCSSCAMCESSCGNAAAPIDGASRFFRPDTKCCTFHPRLPNYLVGALLADTDPALAEGQRRVRERIASRIGVTPQYLRPPAKFDLLYTSSRRVFGKTPTLLCPYYEREQGTCTIWAYREAVCSTYYCKYVAGADGRKLWMTLKSYLALVEIQLSRYALLKLVPEHIQAGGHREAPREGEPLTLEALEDKAPPAKEYEALWRGWAGREVELYKASYEIVRALSAEDVERIMGLDSVLDLVFLEKLHQAAVSPELPKVLRFNPDATVQWLPDGTVALGAYSEHDALAFPGEAYALLVEFRGTEPVAAVRERLRKEKLADLPEDVLLTLHQYRILIEA